MPDSLPLTPSTDPEPLCISGMLAIHAARVAVHMPGWPSLHRLVHGKAPQPVSLAEAEADLLRGWGVSGYVYPAPRALIERERESCPIGYNMALKGDERGVLQCIASAGARCLTGWEDLDAVGHALDVVSESVRAETEAQP